MRILSIAGLVILMTACSISGDRGVLVEMFTNSHCPICAGVHTIVKGYLGSSNASQVRYIYYHQQYPYPTDPLYQDNTTQPAARDQFYGPYNVTPVVFIDGQPLSNVSSYATAVDNRVTVQSPFTIELTGSVADETLQVDASITQTAAVSQSDLVVHVVIVESSLPAGNNGIQPQDYVMRDMITGPTGEAFSIALNETKMVSKSFVPHANWTTANLGVVVFVQSSSTREVYQSEYISASALTSAGAQSDLLPETIRLDQNFPNPFNPSTTIRYTIPSRSQVSISLFDIVGNEVGAIEQSVREQGEYTLTLDFTSGPLTALPSGIYFCRLTVEDRNGLVSRVRKMMYLK